MVELLSPAGSIASMKAAISAGADAVYMGGPKFGARAYAENPDIKGLIEALDFCHFHGRRLYLTVNTLLKEKELTNELFEYLLPLYQEGLDAVIVQDYGVLSFIRENFPSLKVHASTQMAVGGYFGAKMLKEMGVTRLILPREQSLSEIKRVTLRGGIETECFIHGALCYSYSGQCLMSSLIGGRSGNRGRCAQVCRLAFPDEHLLNLKDLMTLEILPDIIDTGVVSLKIEGRMKSPRYTAGVTSVYRKYIDMYLDGGREKYKVSKADIQALSELFDRGGTSTGYFNQHNGKKMIYKGEKPEIRTPDENLIKQIDEKYINKDLTVPVTVKVKVRTNENAEYTLSDGTYTVKATGEYVSKAINNPLSKEEVCKQAGKLGKSSFEATKIDVNLSDDAFVPISCINHIRREAVDKLTKERINGYKRSNF